MQADMATASNNTAPQATAGTKKPPGSQPSNIPLKIDYSRQCVVLPTEMFEKESMRIWNVEEALTREILQMAFSALVYV